MVSKTNVTADIAQVRELHKKFNTLMDAGDHAGARKTVDDAMAIILKDPAAMAGAE